MSRLQELIDELCPDGVEYRTIGECVQSVKKIKWSDTDGKSFSYIDLTSVDIDEKRIIGTQNISADNAPSRAQQIVLTGDILLGTTRPMLKRYCVVTDDWDGQVCSTGFCVLRANEKKIYLRWLYHIISSTDFFVYIEKYQQGASYPSVSDIVVKQYAFPVPPLEVQREIVRILDNFTELTAELTAELTTELTERKKQYEYYRENLLSIKADDYVPLREICDIKGRIGFRGYTRNDLVRPGDGAISFSPGNILNENINFDKCSYISWSKYDESPEIKVEVEDILLCKTGSTLGKVAMVEYLPEKATINPQLVVLKNIKCNNKYLKYILGAYPFQTEMQSHKGLGSVPNISQKEIGNIVIPIHDDQKQRYIVSILDKLYFLCNNLSTGLPAEIEARQKQYEYYRDKLLTFKELS